MGVANFWRLWMRKAKMQRIADLDPQLYALDENGNATRARGTAVPSGVAGYALDCLFTRSDSAGLLYINTGTVDSCTFTQIASLGSTPTFSGAVTMGDTLDVTGEATFVNATCSGTLDVAGVSTLGVTNTAALTCTTLAPSGATTLQATTIDTTLGVTGTSTLGTVNAGALACTTLAPSGTTTAAAITCTTLANSGALTSTAAITTTDGVASGTARKVGGTVKNLTAAGTTHTNSTDEAVLASYSIPADTLKAGTLLKVRAFVVMTSTVGATTTTVKLRLGPTTLTGTVLFASAAKDAVDNEVVSFDFWLQSRAAPSATSALVGSGFLVEQEAPGSGAVKSVILTATNFATNGILLLEVTGDMSAADGTSMTCHQMDVEVVG